MITNTCQSYKATINAKRDPCVLPAGHATLVNGYATPHEAAARNGMRPWWRHEDGRVVNRQPSRNRNGTRWTLYGLPGGYLTARQAGRPLLGWQTSVAVPLLTF